MIQTIEQLYGGLVCLRCGSELEIGNLCNRCDAERTAEGHGRNLEHEDVGPGIDTGGGCVEEPPVRHMFCDEHTGLNLITLRQFTRDGKVIANKVERRIMLTPAELDRWLDEAHKSADDLCNLSGDDREAATQ